MTMALQDAAQERPSFAVHVNCWPPCSRAPAKAGSPEERASAHRRAELHKQRRLQPAAAAPDPRCPEAPSLSHAEACLVRSCSAQAALERKQTSGAVPSRNLVPA